MCSICDKCTKYKLYMVEFYAILVKNTYYFFNYMDVSLILLKIGLHTFLRTSRIGNETSLVPSLVISENSPQDASPRINPVLPSLRQAYPL